MFEGWSFLLHGSPRCNNLLCLSVRFKGCQIILLQLKGFTKQTGCWRTGVLSLCDTKTVVWTLIMNVMWRPWNENKGEGKSTMSLYATCSSNLLCYFGWTYNTMLLTETSVLWCFIKWRRCCVMKLCVTSNNSMLLEVRIKQYRLVNGTNTISFSRAVQLITF